MVITIDTTKIREAQRTMQEGKRNGDHLVLSTTLSSYKMKTIMNKPLPKEDYPKVLEIIKRLAENEWLTEEDSAWCLEQGIVVN